MSEMNERIALKILDLGTSIEAVLEEFSEIFRDYYEGVDFDYRRPKAICKVCGKAIENPCQVVFGNSIYPDPSEILWNWNAPRPDEEHYLLCTDHMYEFSSNIGDLLGEKLYKNFLQEIIDGDYHAVVKKIDEIRAAVKFLREHEWDIDISSWCIEGLKKEEKKKK